MTTLLAANSALPHTSPQRKRGQSAVDFLLPAIAVSLAFVLACPVSAAERVVWELRPYEVRVVLAPDDAPQWTGRRLRSLATALRDAARATFGRQWKLEAFVADVDARRALHAARDEAASERAHEALVRSSAAGDRAAAVDKAIVLALRGTATGGVLAAREWDAETGTWGPSIERPAAARGDLAAAAFGAVAAAFSPQARCEKVEGDRLTVRLRAAQLPPRDPRAAPLRPGAIIRLAQRGAGGADAQLADTYLVVEKNDGRDAVCLVHSRYAEPLGAIADSPSEWLALGVSAPSGETRLRLTDAAGAPLAGCQVLSSPLATGSPLPLGRTDGEGLLTVPAGDSPLRVLLVQGGDEVLARLPLVPGWKPEVVVALDVDAARLAAQQATTALRLRLLEEVTRCETLLAEARRKARAGDADGARAALASARQRQQSARETLALAAKQGRPADDAASGTAVGRLWQAFDRAVAERLAPARVEAIENELFPPPPPVETPPAETPPAAGTPPAGTAPAAES